LAEAFYRYHAAAANLSFAPFIRKNWATGLPRMRRDQLGNRPVFETLDATLRFNHPCWRRATGQLHFFRPLGSCAYPASHLWLSL